MVRISCYCKFDITKTGVTGYYRPAQIPYDDQAGHKIVDQTTWIRSRNQQRNWETITQIISLRTQVFDLLAPVKKNDHWYFEFTVDSISVYTNQFEFDILKHDAHNVPMLIIDDTDEYQAGSINTEGVDANLCFNHLTINNNS